MFLKRKKKKNPFSTTPCETYCCIVFFFNTKIETNPKTIPLICFISSANKQTNTDKNVKAIKLTLCFGFLYNQTISMIT